MQSISTKVHKLPYYDGLDDVNIFLDHFERDVLKEHRFQALDLDLRATLSRCWGTHKDNIADGKEYHRLMRLIFGFATMCLSEKCTSKHDPHKHMA